eukprot:3230527-Prymnesium_polylepis.1
MTPLERAGPTWSRTARHRSHTTRAQAHSNDENTIKSVRPREGFKKRSTPVLYTWGAVYGRPPLPIPAHVQGGCPLHP